MPSSFFIGEFEQLVLLALLREPQGAHALHLREALGDIAGREVSRGALYRTLERLEQKGMIEWELEDADVPERGGHPRRRFRVAPDGIAALRASRRTLLGLWSGLEEVLK